MYFGYNVLPECCTKGHLRRIQLTFSELAHQGHTADFLIFAPAQTNPSPFQEFVAKHRVDAVLCIKRLIRSGGHSNPGREGQFLTRAFARQMAER